LNPLANDISHLVSDRGGFAEKRSTEQEAQERNGDADPPQMRA